MDRDMNTYLDFAENDYQFFSDAYNLGLKGSAIAANGQNICERYLKHIVSVYAIPESEDEKHQKESVMKTHSLLKLIRYIKNDMELSIPKETEDAMRRIDGFYFTTRYPGDNSFHPTAQEADEAMDAVLRTREYIYSVIQSFDSESTCEKATC